MSVSAAVGLTSLFGGAVMGGVSVVAGITRQRCELGLATSAGWDQGLDPGSTPVLMMLIVTPLGVFVVARAFGIRSGRTAPFAA